MNEKKKYQRHDHKWSRRQPNIWLSCMGCKPAFSVISVNELIFCISPLCALIVVLYLLLITTPGTVAGFPRVRWIPDFSMQTNRKVVSPTSTNIQSSNKTPLQLLCMKILLKILVDIKSPLNVISRKKVWLEHDFIPLSCFSREISSLL